jgi:DoxX-like protein
MKMQTASISKKRRMGGNFLIGLTGLPLIGSAVSKFAHIPAVVTQMAAIGFDNDRLMFVAFLEVVCTALFLIPATRSIGLLLISAYLGGAVATHLQHGLPLSQPSFVLALIWLGMWLRHPEILWSFGKSGASGNALSYQEQRKGAAQGV